MPTPDASPARRPRGRPGHDQDAVLRVAIDLFIRQGYDATSVTDVARQLGVTKSAIFHHFDSKEALLAAALDEALAGLDAVVEAAADESRHDSAYARLQATVEAAVEILVRHQPAVTLLLRVRGNSPLEQEALERRRHIDDRLATVVKQAAAEGDLRTDLDPEIVSRLVFGTVNSLVDWYDPDGPIHAETIASSVASVLFDGLSAPSPPAE